MEKLSYSVTSFAELNDVSRSYVFDQIRAGSLKSFKAGRRTLISAEAAAAWRGRLERETAEKRADPEPAEPRRSRPQRRGASAEASP